MNHTIAAIATPQAAGGIGVIRISGPKALQIADAVFQAASGLPLAQSKGYRAHFGRVFHESGPIDEAIALVFRAPHSYTGEDVVELSCTVASFCFSRRCVRFFRRVQARQPQVNLHAGPF